MLLRYPDGLTGLALLILRFSAALVVYSLLMPLRGAHFNWWAEAVAAALLMLALVAGIATRVAAALVLAAVAVNLTRSSAATSVLLLSSGTSVGALFLSGAGAYSVDARRFGRRVIRLGLPSPDRGSGG